MLMQKKYQPTRDLGFRVQDLVERGFRFRDLSSGEMRSNDSHTNYTGNRTRGITRVHLLLWIDPGAPHLATVLNPRPLR